MGREQFLAQATAAALPLHLVTVRGITFHARETSVLDVRLSLERRALSPDGVLSIARQMAAIMLDEAGRPLFDQASDADMQALRDVLDGLPASFPSEVNKARAAFDPPVAAHEVDPQGN